MKGLIIRSPHIDNILSGLKSWEMRSRKTNVRGRIALIKAGTGKIYGEADLVEVLEPLECEAMIHMSWQFHRVARSDRHKLAKWKYPWRLENAVKYDEPKPYDHPQGAVTWVNLPNSEK